MLRFEFSKNGDVNFRRLYFHYYDELKQYMTDEILPIETWYDERYGNADELQRYFIFDDYHLIGFVIFQYVDASCGIDPPIWYLVEFYILPECRRKGYGTKSVEKALLKCNGELFIYVLKQNIPAINFWNNVELRLHLIRHYRFDIAIDDDVELRILRNQNAANCS